MGEATPVAVDTSVIVAGLLGWHRDHDRARALLDAALASGGILLPSRVLIESYSVLTRMPAPHRLAPQVALDLLQGTFHDLAAVIEFPAEERWRFLHELVDDEVAGGAAYDAEIVATATRAGARRLLTLTGATTTASRHPTWRSRVGDNPFPRSRISPDLPEP